MELRALWQIVKRRWWLIALPGIVALLYAAYGYVTSPTGVGYSTSIKLTAAAPPGAEASNYEDTEYYPWLASEYVVNALTDWVRSATFAQEVSALLAEQEIDVPPGVVQSSIAADNTRSIMTLYVSGGDPDVVLAIAQAAPDALNRFATEYWPQFGDDGVEVVALDTPVVGTVPPPLSARFDPLIRLGLGLAAGVALAFLAEYLDPSLHSRREVEDMGISVLAEIPE